MIPPHFRLTPKMRRRYGKTHRLDTLDLLAALFLAACILITILHLTHP